MLKHTKIYFDYYKYIKADFIACEICLAKSVDIHHLSSKGMGGSKKKDYIGNLIALCRSCHEKCHSDKEFNETAREIHISNL